MSPASARLAAKIIAIADPAVARELAARKEEILAKVGVVQRMVLRRYWGLVEAESVRIFEATVAQLCDHFDGLKIVDAVLGAMEAGESR